MKKETEGKLINFGVKLIQVCFYVQLALLIGKIINTVIAPWWVIFSPALLVVSFFLFICFVSVINAVIELLPEYPKHKSDK